MPGLLKIERKMKKLFLSAIVAIGFLGTSSGQFRLMNQNGTAETEDDTLINDGDVVVFNTYEYNAAKLKFLTYNDSSDDMFVRVECEGLTNTNGAHMEVCYGFCYTGIETFVGYPLDNPVYVAPGTHQGIFDDYFSNVDGSSDLIEYNFRFYQTDAEGFEIEGTSYRFTYRYDANMAISDVTSSIAIAEVYPTVVKGFTNVTLKENAKVQVLNLEGKVVKTLEMLSGNSQLDLSGLAAGTYLVQFQGISGLNTTKKIVVK